MDVVVEEPNIRQREFRNLDAALDFCKMTQPQFLSIEAFKLNNDAVKYVLSYQGSEGQL